MAWARLLVVCAAVCAVIALVPSVARAQSGVTGRVRYLAGYTHETPETLGSENDLWAGVTPELSYLFDERRWTLRATYAFTANVHTRNPNEIANRLTLVSSFEVSKRTSLLVSLDANQTSLSNYFITRPQLDSAPLVVTTTSNSRLLVVAAGQGLTWEASPTVRLGERVDTTYLTSLDPEVTIRNSFTNLTLNAERSWKRDSVGAEVRGGYATVFTPPPDAQQPPPPPGSPLLETQKFMTVTAAPLWRHDINPELSSLLSAGASVVFSPEGRTDTIFTPFGRASLLYTLERSSAELSYIFSAAPNMLAGQMLRSHLATLRGTTPISERHRVFAGGSVGYLHGDTIDLRDNPAPMPDIDAFLVDAEVTWSATPWMQVFGRAMFIAQEASANVPPFVREAFLVGVQFSTRSAEGVAIPVRFPQRVDRSDGAPRP